MLKILPYSLMAVIFFVMPACTDINRPDDIIHEDTYIDLLAELHLLNALEETYPDSTLRDSGFENVLSYYNITIEVFEESHEYYLQDVEGQRERLEEAQRQLQDEYQRINEINEEILMQRREERQQERERNNLEEALSDTTETKQRGVTE